MGCGGGSVTGRELRAVVRWERDSRRCVSDLELRRERWCVNCASDEGALSRRDCWLSVIACSSRQFVACRIFSWCSRESPTLGLKTRVCEIVRLGLGLADFEFGFLAG